MRRQVDKAHEEDRSHVSTGEGQIKLPLNDEQDDWGNRPAGQKFGRPPSKKRPKLGILRSVTKVRREKKKKGHRPSCCLGLMKQDPRPTIRPSDQGI